MKETNKNIQSIVITTIISLITIVTVFGGFMSTQAKLEVQLANIQKELTVINEKLEKRDDKITVLEKNQAVMQSEINTIKSKIGGN